MFKVEVMGFDKLTEDEKKDQPSNGNGKEYSCYIKITNGDEVVAIYSDAMEPEDCTFCRDLSWVADAIESAYKLGKESI